MGPRASWWLSGKESAGRCRRHRFNPWSGKIPHAAEQLSPRATNTEPVLWSRGGVTREATAMRSLCTATRRSPQLEKSLCGDEDPAQPETNKQTNKYKFKKKSGIENFSQVSPREKASRAIQKWCLALMALSLTMLALLRTFKLQYAWRWCICVFFSDFASWTQNTFEELKMILNFQETGGICRLK